MTWQTKRWHFGGDLSWFWGTSTHTQTQKIFLTSSGVVHRTFHIPISLICNLQIQFQNQFGCNLYHRVVRLLHPPTKKVVYDRSSVYMQASLTKMNTFRSTTSGARISKRISGFRGVESRWAKWSQVGPKICWGYLWDISGYFWDILGIPWLGWQ